PYVIAETLARQSLVERLLHRWNGGEEPLGGETTLDARAQVQAAARTGLQDADYALSAVPLAACAGDTWSTLYQDFPDPRFEHTAIWTGSEMIVWGGNPGWTGINSGGRYDPATDTWTMTSIGAGVPVGRGGHTAVWTGTEMIVWGGYDYDSSNGVTTY